MKALILAAGRGTRLGVLTENRPKPMLPIAGTPMIERIMTSLNEQAGITEFVLITGYLSQVLEEYFGDGSNWGWRVEYVHQEVPRGVSDAVNTASAALSDAPFFMTYGDIMLDPANYGAAVAEFAHANADGKNCKAIVGLNWVDDPYRGSAVYLDETYRIERIQEKPEKGTATTHWNSAGLFVFDPLIFEFTSKIQPSARGEYELPDAISAMISGGHYVQGLPLTGDWRDVGTPEDYAAINDEFGVKK
ncbi:MAG: sugar phosphate nucleotidyltransferase [Capsulimonas sp.]|uniref:nucleotidyltransferase family protein n=1 Tax=Capsulimonas sp. TaxID=2494211 RepID=UPI0032668F37